jgi:peptide-methionine (R)-S-oxide reductase
MAKEPRRKNLPWRKKGTERAFTGRYWDNPNPACIFARRGNALFHSDESLSQDRLAVSGRRREENVSTENDNGLFMRRTEALCGGDAHLGHVFEDGPKPTGRATALTRRVAVYTGEKTQEK